MTEVNPTSRNALMEMITAYRLSQALHVAAVLGVADHLKEGPRSVEDLAEATETPAPTLYRGNLLESKFADLNMLVMLGGRERTAGDFERLYATAGFTLTRIIPTGTGFDISEGSPA